MGQYVATRTSAKDVREIGGPGVGVAGAGVQKEAQISVGVEGEGCRAAGSLCWFVLSHTPPVKCNNDFVAECS